MSAGEPLPAHRRSGSRDRPAKENFNLANISANPPHRQNLKAALEAHQNYDLNAIMIGSPSPPQKNSHSPGLKPCRRKHSPSASPTAPIERGEQEIEGSPFGASDIGPIDAPAQVREPFINFTLQKAVEHQQRDQAAAANLNAQF